MPMHSSLSLLLGCLTIAWLAPVPRGVAQQANGNMDLPSASQSREAPGPSTPATAVVGLVRSDYTQLESPVPADRPLSIAQVEDLVRAAVRHAGGLALVLSPDADIVAIKTNLVEVKASGDGTVTDWRVVRAIARLVHETAPQARVKVIEACNWQRRPDDTGDGDGWAYAGYDRLDSLEYVELVNMHLDSTYTRPIPGGGLTRTDLPYPVVLDSVDCFISAPVVKIIGVVGMTAAMKNMVGMVVMGTDMHRVDILDHSYDYLDETIVDLNLLFRPDFVVADAIVCLERAKTTSWDGQPVRLNAVVASSDVVAADAVSAQLMGLNPDDIEYLTLAERLGMGVADPARIEIRGQTVDQVGRRFERMKSVYERYGQTPRDWVFHGPHPADDSGDDFLDPRRLEVVPGQGGWSAPYYTLTDRVNLKKIHDDPRNCVVYAYTEFDAPRDEAADLWVGSGEAMAVWIDGEEVYSFDRRRRHKVPNDQHRIRLSAGHHELLVKLYQTRGSFDFSLNICEAEDDTRYSGVRVKGLRFALPGNARGPIPRSGGGSDGPAFELGDWLTRHTFTVEIDEVIDRAAGLPEKGIRRLAVDSRGQLWVASNKEVLRRTGDTTWMAYGEGDGLPEGWKNSLFVNPRDGHVWVNIRGKLHEFDGEAWRPHFPDNWHGRIFADPEGRTCASVWQNGLRCFDGEEWINYRQYDEDDDLANWAEAGRIDAAGNVWVGTWGHGVWRYDGSEWTQDIVRDGLADNHVTKLALAPNGDLWAAYACPGISRLRRGKWTSYYPDKGAPSREVESLLAARNGAVWVAAGGPYPTLSRFDGKRWATVTVSSGILDMAETADGRIWLVTDNAVLVARLE